MKPWEHCAMKWWGIDTPKAIQNIQENNIVKCRFENDEYYFNIPGEVNSEINLEMIKTGKWSIYTWSN